MADIHVDSSVWIEYFRSGQEKIFDQLDQLLDEDRVVLCGFVELEIIQGIRLKERDLIEGLFKALPYIETERPDFIEAGEKLNKLRKKGITIPASDCLIATICLRRELFLFDRDKHFDHFTELKRFIS